MGWSRSDGGAGMDMTQGTGWWLIENLLPLWKEYTVWVKVENAQRAEHYGKLNKQIESEHSDKIKQEREKSDALYQQEMAAYNALSRREKKRAEEPWRHYTYPTFPALWNWATEEVSMEGFLSWLVKRETPDGLE